DHRPLPEHVIVLVLNGIENLLPATAEEFNIDCKFMINALNQRKTALEPFTGALDLKLHQGDELGCGAALSNLFPADSKTAQVLQRQINAAFLIIHRNVLPKIRQLQSRACVVGELLAFGVFVAAKIKHKVANRIG